MGGLFWTILSLHDDYTQLVFTKLKQPQKSTKIGLPSLLHVFYMLYKVRTKPKGTTIHKHYIKHLVYIFVLDSLSRARRGEARPERLAQHSSDALYWSGAHLAQASSTSSEHSIECEPDYQLVQLNYVLVGSIKPTKHSKQTPPLVQPTHAQQNPCHITIVVAPNAPLLRHRCIYVQLFLANG